MYIWCLEPLNSPNQMSIWCIKFVLKYFMLIKLMRGRRGRDLNVFGFTITYAISAYHR